MSKIRIIVLDNYVENIGNVLANKYFSMALAFKYNNYHQHYNNGYIPLDQCDYFSKQYILCQEEGDNLIPFSSFRHVYLSRCDHHKIEFPLLKTIRSSQNEENQKYLEILIETSRNSKKELIYPSGFIISRHVKNNPELVSFAREMVGALHVEEHLSHLNPDFITASVLKFKTYRVLGQVGYEFIHQNGRALSAFKKVETEQCHLKLMKVNNLSFWSNSCYKSIMLL